MASIKLNLITVWASRFSLHGVERRKRSFKLISCWIIFKLLYCFSEKKLLGNVLNLPASTIWGTWALKLSSYFKLLKLGVLIKIKCREVFSSMHMPAYTFVGLTFHRPPENEYLLHGFNNHFKKIIFDFIALGKKINPTLSYNTGIGLFTFPVPLFKVTELRFLSVRDAFTLC